MAAITPERVAAMEALLEGVTSAEKQLAARTASYIGTGLVDTDGHMRLTLAQTALLNASRTFVPDLLEAYAATAPKDTPILVLTTHGQYVACNDERIHGTGIFGWSVDDNKHGPYALRGADPTHWLPLPAPPVQEDKP